MNFAEPCILFYCAAFLLLIIEVLLGMTLGVALAGAITFFILGTLSLMKILSAFNHYLIAGSITFFLQASLCLFFLARLFQRSKKRKTLMIIKQSGNVECHGSARDALNN